MRFSSHHALALIAGVALFADVFAEPAQSPLFLTENTESLVMINLSNDHELFFKAYDDYSDIDGDGVADRTYNNDIEYYGYFDSNKCYSYSAGEFTPAATMSTPYYCDNVSGDWSGNFLNWATMTRIDAIRKVLYGGYRSTDNGTGDADYRTVLERSFLPTDAHSFVKYYDAADLNRLTPYAGDISICNTTPASSGNSRDVSAAPEMRVAQGNFSLWTGHEVKQCTWRDEYSSSNSNDPSVTGISASEYQPYSYSAGSAEFVVRVEVCNAALPEENCRVYPDGNRKPIGLLQEYGEDGRILFGLLTGSYKNNKSGGLLRKNVSDFRDEVDETTDGQFSTVPASGGIVDTLNRLRLTRYDYGSGQYNNLDSCEFAKFGFTDGECSNWGNPQSEIFLETLRYFAGLSATAAFDSNATPESEYIVGLSDAAWTDPLSNDNYCAPVNVIQFNASTSSFDGDQLSGFADLPGSPSFSSETQAVGSGEGVTDSGTYFIGQVPGDSDKSCSPKDLDDLADASGVCPEAPWLEGTYHIAGLAYYANQNSIRDDLVEEDGVTEADVRVKTYGVALSPAQPVINVPVPGGDEQVVILPACMEFRTDSNFTSGRRHNGNCAIVDFRIVEPHTVVGNVGTGKFLVLWESAQHGGDYDQDMGGIIRYSVNGVTDEITVITEVYGASTGGIHGFGYVISGTTQDGLHIHSGHNNFSNYPDPYGLLDCTGGCSSGDGETSITYDLGDTVAQRLETPIYYAAKWGGFEEEEDAFNRPVGVPGPDGIPNEEYEWDADGNGLPDTYFFARNPGQLGDQLATVFETIDDTSSASAVVANSVAFQSTTRIYQARFNSANWTGQLLSFPLETATGRVLDPEWDSGEVMSGQAPDARVILSWNPKDDGSGIPFLWDDLNETQQGLLDTSPVSGTADGLGDERLDYLRGDQSLEQSETDGVFRNRTSLLGDNVNSSPAIVGAPSFSYIDTLESTDEDNPNNLYSTFAAQFDDVDCYESDGTTPNAGLEREPIVYFGANDGMLHGVSACDGREVLGYVPNAVLANLPDLTSPTYNHKYYVDGAPTVVDAFIDNNWHTVLVGSTRAGGKSVFALKVTDPLGTVYSTLEFTEANASEIVLWEVDSTTTGFEDLGYTFSQPAVVKAAGHGWVAIFGNGFDSDAGKAVLYIVDLDDGGLQEAIVLDDSGGNGLATVAPVDSDRDGLVDVLYAGDLKGNVWRLESSGNQDFGANNAASLLYTAVQNGGGIQPITSRIEVGRHPSLVDGRMVYFGTGQYYKTADGNPANSAANTFYGIYDDDSGDTVPTVETRTPADEEPPDTDSLQRQVIVQETLEDFDELSYQIRIVSNASVDWENQRGWYLDLPTQGEKVVSNPLLRGGRLIFVTTIPSLSKCKAGGDSWLMEIDAATGGRIDRPVFDFNGDVLIDVNDLAAYTDADGNEVFVAPSGKKSKVGILQPPAIVAGVGGEGTGGFGKAEAKYASGSDGGQIEVTIEDVGLPSAGRKSWIQFK
jgi:type IV pilus assembly protein PilY1